MALVVLTALWHLSTINKLRIAINGKLNSQAPSLDRGLLYGHTVFETIAIVDSTPRLLPAHLERLKNGALRLGIPLDDKLLASELDEFCSPMTQSCLRITLSIGSGGRGYQTPSEPQALRILSEHEYPNYPNSHREIGITLGVSDIRLSHQPLLAGIKHGNRLEQVIARQNWQQDWHEALLLDYQDNVIEANSANVFIVKNKQLFTPKLDQCGVDGVMRSYVIAMASELGFKTEAVSLSLQDILDADEVFLTNSLIGIWPVANCQDQEFNNNKIAQALLNRLIIDEVIPHH